MAAAGCENELLAAAIVAVDMHAIAARAPGGELRLAAAITIEAVRRQA
jgi:hypothetical protein